MDLHTEYCMYSRQSTVTLCDPTWNHVLQIAVDATTELRQILRAFDIHPRPPRDTLYRKDGRMIPKSVHSEY